MDKEELQQKIGLYYSKLPPKAQTVFSSMTWLETLKAISQKYSLTKEQIETLGSNTTLVLLGIIHPDEYEEGIKKEIPLAKEQLDNMIAEINSAVINPTRPELIESFNANVEDLVDENGEIEEKLDARLLKLPPDIKNILDESNYQTTLYNISKFYNLNIAQMGTLEKATTNLIIGSIKPENFEDYLNAHIDISKEKLKGLVNDINEQIFKKIREKILLLGEEKSNKQILSGAGIEILPHPSTLDLIEIPAPTTPLNREELITKIENPEKVRPVRSMSPQGDSSTLVLEKAASNGIHPILAQKLSGSFQTPVVETKHSLENLSSSNKPSMPLVANKPKIDPYRELPE